MLPVMDERGFKRSIEFAALAYAIGAKSYEYNHNEVGVGLKQSTSFFGSLLQVMKNSSEVKSQPIKQWTHFKPENVIDATTGLVKKLKSPVNTSFSGEIWSYAFDERIFDEYDVHPLIGLYGESAEKSGAIVGVVAVPKFTNQDKNIYVSFKGTQGGVGAASAVAGLFGKSTPEWNTNMTISESKFFDSPGVCHKGFYNAFISVASMLEEIINRLSLNNAKIIVSGHSLGAAQATLAAYYLKKYCHCSDIYLVSLATPILGNAEFINDIEMVLNSSINSFYLKGDPVKQSPRFGWIDLRSAKDLSPWLPCSLVGDKNHYFEAILHGIYRAFHFGKKKDNVLVMQITKDKNLILQDPSKVTGLFLVKEDYFNKLWSDISRPQTFKKGPKAKLPPYSGGEEHFESTGSFFYPDLGRFSANNFDMYK